MNINLTDLIFTDADKAREYFEAIRWPNGPFCPHCGEAEKVYRLNGKSHRPGLLHCNGCDEAFTVTVGSVMERSHIPLNKWALAFRLMSASKKGVSAHQLHRTLGITYKSAWFMAHRIREAMKPTKRGPLGGKGKRVEADETYIGRIAGQPIIRGGQHRMRIVSLVERGGEIRSFRVEDVNVKTVMEIVNREVDRKSHLRTDQAGMYKTIGKRFASHKAVNHSVGEYVRDDAHTNTLENYFSVFKRGMKGVYQHCGEQHLQRYLTEFDFRYSNRAGLEVDDTERTARAVKGAAGRRLSYQQTN